MRKIAFLFPGVLMLMAVLVACGDDDDDQPTAGDETSAATTTEVTDSTSGTTPAATETAGSASPTGEVETGIFPITIQHAMGETTIPAAPERVVVLDTGELDSVTALGITPVGAVRAPVEDGLLSYLKDATQGTELVGTISEPDLELIAALKPDLILSSKLRHEAIYDALLQIAPTVFTETVGVTWEDNFLVDAEALGKRAEAEAMLAGYHERAEALGASLAEPKPKISLVRFMPEQIRLYQNASFIGTILKAVGLPRPESQDVDEFALVVSAEQVNLMEGDFIFVAHYGPAEETARSAVVDGALWQSLGAVQEGRVYDVPDDTWMLGIGIQAANIVLDDLEQYLADWP